MIRRPPRSTLFPTRRSSDLLSRNMDTGIMMSEGDYDAATKTFTYTGEIEAIPGMKQKNRRSEEHTSELQSRPHLVCRLLLEKKNTYHSPTSRSCVHAS